MNLYVYLKTSRQVLPEIEGLELGEFERAAAWIQESGHDFAWQQEQIELLVNRFRNSDNRPAVLAKWKEKKPAAHPEKTLREWADGLLFVPLYLGLYVGVYQTISAGGVLDGSIDFRFSAIAEALLVWLIVKAVMELFARGIRGWKRWGALIALFAVYLGGMYFMHGCKASATMPLWLLLVLCGLVFGFGYWLHVQWFEKTKERKNFV